MSKRLRPARPALGIPLVLGTLLALGACAWWPASGPEWYAMPAANRGPERYSAWFGDARGTLLYFGLSAFWSASWAAGSDPRADLAEAGDQLIGRFDLARRRFLPPLRVRADGVRSSVWDVLAHSGGRVWFTTFYEAMGSVGHDGGDLRLHPELGDGLNELYEGADGRVYVTRYAAPARADATRRRSGVLVLEPDGTLVRELALASPPGAFSAAKSLAVDPASGEIWLNTDLFLPDGAIAHETVRLAADGRELARRRGEPELLFARFDARGRGWFAEREHGRLRARLVDGARVLERELGPLPAVDFVQDIHFGADGRAALARWSGVVHVLRDAGGALAHATVAARPERPCALTAGPPLLYSAVPYRGSVFATVYCGGAVVRLPLPPLQE